MKWLHLINTIYIVIHIKCVFLKAEFAHKNTKVFQISLFSKHLIKDHKERFITHRARPLAVAKTTMIRKIINIYAHFL